MKSNSLILSNFKDRQFLNDWHRNTIATANAQDIADVLNPNYSPTSPKDIELFYEKQKFM